MRSWFGISESLLVLLLAASARASIQLPPLPVRTVAPEIRSAEGARKTEATIEKAFKSFQQGQIDACLDLLKSATEAQPNLPPARLMLARLFFGENRIPEGRPHLEQAAAEQPNHPSVYLTFGKLALAEGRLTDGLVQLEKAASLEIPATWGEEQKLFLQIQVAAGRAMVADRREQWDAARAALSHWLELEPDNAAARHRLGGVLFELGQSEEAFKELERAVEQEKNLEPAAVSIGWLYDKKGDHKTAGEWMARAVKQAPEDAKAHLGYAAWLLERARLEEAKAEAEIAGELNPDNTRVRMLRGLIARGLKQYEEAEGFFFQVHQQLPADFEATNQLALVLAEQADETKRQQALQLAALSQRQYPRESAALSTLGWVYYRLGKVEEAKQALRAAVSRGPARSETDYFLAQVLAQHGPSDEAAKARERLTSTIENPGMFLLRPEARKWLAEAGSDSVGTVPEGSRVSAQPRE